jgi:hypothetical protein
MPNHLTTSATPVAIVDTLNSLLETEISSIFRFMGEGSPYLNRASGEIRRPLQQMVLTNERHCSELYSLIDDLGGIPHDRAIQSEEQYLAYLSLEFLLPKLLDAKRLTVRRYENALKAIGDSRSDVTSTLESHLAEHRSELVSLEKAATHALRKK